MFAVAANAQASTQDRTSDDRGYLQALLEDNLSDAGRDVRIKGFTGALSSKASLEELTIADGDGIWITLKGVALEWNRSALLAGRLEVTRLTAREILLPRLPVPAPGLSPDVSQATVFALPELPVSVQIGEISAARVLLGKPVLGTEVALRVTGSVSLAGGEGAARLRVARADGRGTLMLDAAYANSSDILALDLALDEAENGIAASLLGLPGSPSLSLKVKGKDPLSAYTAQIALASDGAPRLMGDVKIIATQDSVTKDGVATAPGRQFSANLTGDISPLVAAQYRGFFGDESTLVLSGFRQETGALEISELSLMSGVLSLNGQLNLSADGWPRQFRLTGGLRDQGRIRLPIAGPGTWVDGVGLSAQFDAAQGNEWRADVTFEGLDRDGLTIRQGRLIAAGVLRTEAPKSVRAHLDFDLLGLVHADPALARALGAQMIGDADLIWAQGAPLTINGLELRSGDLHLTGAGTLDGLAEGFPVTGGVQVESGDLARFAQVLDRDIGGFAKARVKGSGALLGGAFDIAVAAQTRDLRTDTAQLDPLLVGPSTLSLVITRDPDGTALKRLVINNDAASIRASGQVNSAQGALELSAQITEVSRIEPRLSGPASVDGKLRWAFGGDVTLDALDVRIAQAALAATGRLSPHVPGLPATGRVTASVEDLSRFAALAGQDLGGRVDLKLSGAGDIKGEDFQLSIAVDGGGVRTGIAPLDQLIAGSLKMAADVGRRGQLLDIRKLSVISPQLSLRADAVNDTAGAPVDITARLANLGLFAPGFAGPVSARGRVQFLDDNAGEIRLDLNAAGPGGTSAKITGSLYDLGKRADLALSGAAPLGLANGVIAPRSVQGMAQYDLRLSGVPGLAALSGVIRTSNARLALPTLDFAVGALAGTVSLAARRAQIELSGTSRDGGTIRVNGPVNLTAPYQGDIAVDLTNIALSDRLIYATTVTGRMSVTGPLTGGASIGGTLSLGETNIRIPSSGGVETETLPDIHHRGEPAAVLATRRRAGLIQDASSGSARPFLLDLMINAPRRIFVRGRGLDAELGGRIRLTGTTNAVTPSGFFQLIRGRLDILGKRLILTEGLVDLRGALDPYLRFVAQTDADGVSVEIVIEGLASALEITFQSQPELPQEEVVSHLLFGRGLDTISPFQAVQLVSAIATLAGRSGNGVVGRLRDKVGLSDLDVTSTDEGGTEVRAGAYLSENIYSDVTVDSTGRQEINLNLDLSPRVTVKGGLDSEGGTGLGIFFEKDY